MESRHHDLGALFAPRSIAVVGVSADRAKWGHILARRALSSGRRVTLVGRSGGQVLGHPVLTSLRDAVEPVDLVCVCVPAHGLVAAVSDAVAIGAQAVVVITAGLGELGAEGARIERAAVAVAAAAGAVLVGPNCLGVADTTTGLQLAHAELPPGEVTILSQSGNVVLDVAASLAERGLGVARFVSLGNQADLDVATAMRACVDHDGTRAVAVYVEDVRNGADFVAAARALGEAGKPVCLLSPGRSAAAVRGAASHTGAMTSASEVIDAACTAAGIRRVDHPGALVDLLEGVLGERRVAGPRIAVLTDGGGHGAMTADAVEAVGLQVPMLGETTRARLREVLGATSALTNPVDLAGAGDGDPAAYAAAVRVLLAADDVDGVLLTGYFGGYSTEPGQMGGLELAAAHEMATAVHAQSKAVVVHTIFPAGPSAQVLRQAGVPVHREIDRAAAVVSGLRRRALPPQAPRPAPVRPLVDTSYEGARAVFAQAGVRFPVACRVTAPEELADALTATGFPVVCKALGALHKSDGGGVVLGLPDVAAVRAAYDHLVTRLDPPAVSVEQMVDLSVGAEVIVGCVRDPRFGPVVMVGLGGVHAEVLADTATALAPVERREALRLLRSLRAAPVLLGARSRTPVDLDVLADVIVAVSQVAAAHPEIAELELNPVLATPLGAVALDARIVLG